MGLSEWKRIFKCNMNECISVQWTNTPHHAFMYVFMRMNVAYFLAIRQCVGTTENKYYLLFTKAIRKEKCKFLILLPFSWSPCVPRFQWRLCMAEKNFHLQWEKCTKGEGLQNGMGVFRRMESIIFPSSRTKQWCSIYKTEINLVLWRQKRRWETQRMSEWVMNTLMN